ncbi:MAG TPA: hypothetical protein DCM05_13580 [Elusimicrobia bacterium]|nr:hypothetical protein [Elusimicrobiota bacterium]
MSLVLAALLGLLASASSAELADTPALSPEQAGRLARESRGFEQFVLVRMGQRGVDVKALRPEFRARLRLVIAHAARQVPQEFVQAAQVAPRMSQDDLSRLFLSIEQGPDALAQFLSEQAALAGIARDEARDTTAIPESVKKRWDSGETVTRDASFQGVLSDALGAEKEAPVVDLRSPSPASPAGKRVSLKDLKPLAPLGR